MSGNEPKSLAEILLSIEASVAEAASSEPASTAHESTPLNRVQAPAEDASSAAAASPRTDIRRNPGAERRPRPQTRRVAYVVASLAALTLGGSVLV